MGKCEIMGMHKNIFIFWVEELATEEQQALPFDQQLRLCLDYMEDPENMADAIRLLDKKLEEHRMWAEARRPEVSQ